MSKRILPLLLLATLVSFTMSSFVVAAANSTIEGFVKDAQTGEPLPGSNVVLVKTGLGASTNLTGKFTIRNVPPGTYTLRATYIGYKDKELTVQVNEGENLKQDFTLAAVGVQGEEVVVTAQATGQNEAINQQLSAQSIVNVVSSARIQELPDANAAESVGRLPGVSILRAGGEGTEIVIRGLQPKYNTILIDGIRMASSNPNDRSVDLSMISSNMLDGIEVSKAVTPDQDADVLGGTVNFKMKESGEATEGIGVGLLAQGAYNGLSNAQYKYNNYKYVASVTGRFLEEKRLGLFAQADFERRNLQSNELGAAYSNSGSSTVDYLTNGLNLNDIPRDRKRANGTVVLDYRLPEGKIRLSNFLSTGSTDIQNRGEFYDIQNNLHNTSLAYSASTLNLITNALNVDHQLGLFHANLGLSHTYSETKNPNNWTVGFQQASAGLGQFLNKANVDPKAVPTVATIDDNSSYLGSLVTNSSFSRERALTASLDLSTPINVSDMISTMIKFGGKYRYQTRSNLYEQYSGQGLGLVSANYIDNLIASHFPTLAQYANTTSIPIVPFLDRGYNYGKFLSGDYPLVQPLNYGMLSEVVNFVMSNAALIQQNDAISFFHDNYNSTTYNYDGNEKQSAVYAMATVNIGPDFTIIPGVRYQDLQTTYTAARGQQNTGSATGGGPYRHYDTTLTVDHGYWLPDVSIRYRPLPWFDVRLSYTNTLAYPDYNAIVPRNDVSVGNSIAWNNYQLVPSRSTNYDLYFSFYNNSIGLFTVGGFLKRITDLIYPWTFYVSGNAALQYFPPNLGATASNAVYSVSTFVNNSNRIDDYGMELDWQTHFWYLPHPFDGLVMNVNYTHIFSKAQYPYTDVQRVGRQLVFVDTSFTDRLLFQPDDIVNLSLGYDYEGFSIRVSMLYQGTIFTGTNYWPQLRTSTSAYTRWDLSLKQNLPWFGLQVFGDINNINSVNDVAVINGRNVVVPQSEQSYGLTADIGIRWRL
jgi:TonB-dependent receptor